MKIRRIEVGQMKANCYLVIDKENEKALVVDPGDDADYIMRIISDEDVEPEAVIATHAHFDHIMAATEIKLAYNVPFLLCRKDEFLLSKMTASARRFTGVVTAPAPTIDVPLSEGILNIGNWKIDIIPTPGHTPGSVSLYFKQENVVFVGDLVFNGGYVGRTDFGYCVVDDLHRSIARILKLSKETVCYSGHGKETTVGLLREILTD